MIPEANLQRWVDTLGITQGFSHRGIRQLKRGGIPVVQSTTNMQNRDGAFMSEKTEAVRFWGLNMDQYDCLL